MREYKKILNDFNNIIIESDIEERPLTEEEKEELNHPFIRDFVVDPEQINTKYEKYLIDTIAEQHAVTYLLGKISYEIYKHNLIKEKERDVTEEEIWENIQKEIHQRKSINPIKNTMISIADKRKPLDTRVNWMLIQNSKRNILELEKTSIIEFLPKSLKKDLEWNQYDMFKSRNFVLSYLGLYLFYIGSDIEDYISKRLSNYDKYQQDKLELTQPKEKIKVKEKDK